ncbi:SRPBCC family protein [Erythrobacter sp. R86502]|uniref:SRPBCC family protein n=1 Tax=Erythrobacter sp. R86502 TaxID=3093846 RepID=UPI0036D39CC9
MTPRSRICGALLGLAAFGMSVPATAEVTRSTDISFVSRHEVMVEASPKEVWLALISPSGWWTSEHTWSGDAKNLTLTPQAGGCFCETIPEVDEPGRFTLQGSVEHMRIVQAYPESALRMIGSLGPLQSEPVTGVLTIALTKVSEGTRIVWEYNVGGAMRYEVPVISKAVDGVMGAQIAALAKPLRVVAAAKDNRETVAPASTPPSPGTPAAKAADSSAVKPASVDDAFGDLADEPKPKS